MEFRALLHCKIAAESPVGEAMKRIAIFVLLLSLGVAASLPAAAQRISPAENERQSQKAAKKQQKMLKKSNKKQQKSSKKYQKKQQKATKKANRRLKK